jgi:hypothetical protein
MTNHKNIFILSPAMIIGLLVFSAAVCHAQNTGMVQLSARLAADEVPINREAVLTVEAHWVGKPGDISIVSLEPPALTNLKLVSTATSNQIIKENDAQVTLRRYEFYLSGETLGMAYIDEVKLKYRDASGDEMTLRTARLQLQIIDPVFESLTNYSLPVTIAGTLLLLGLAAFIYYINERRKKSAREAEQAESEKTLEEQYRDRLKEEIDLHADNLAEQYNTIAALLREYLHKAHNLESSAQTTQELIDDLNQQQFEMSKITTIQEILQACDLVKFSGSAAEPNQLARLYTLFEAILREPIRTEVK